MEYKEYVEVLSRIRGREGWEKFQTYNLDNAYEIFQFEKESRPVVKEASPSVVEKEGVAPAPKSPKTTKRK